MILNYFFNSYYFITVIYIFLYEKLFTGCIILISSHQSSCIGLLDVNIKVFLIIHLSMTFVNMLSLRGRWERKGGRGMTGRRCRRNRCPRRCRSSGPVRMVAMVPMVTASGGMRDRASPEWNGASARLRASDVPTTSPLFLLPFVIRARNPRLALRSAVVGVPVCVLRVVATPLAVRRRRASRRRRGRFCRCVTCTPSRSIVRDKKRERETGRTVRCAPFGEFDSVDCRHYARQSIAFWVWIFYPLVSGDAMTVILIHT